VFFTVQLRPVLAVDYLSDTIQGALGISVAEALAGPSVILDRLDADHRASLEALLANAEPGEQITVDLTWLSADHRPVFTRCAMHVRQRLDGAVVVEGSAVDVTDFHRERATLNERLRLIAESCSDVVWTQSGDGSLAYICDAIERTRGITRDEALRQTIAQMHPPESAARIYGYLRRLFDALSSGTALPDFQGEQQYYRADGSLMFGEMKILPHFDQDGKFVELIGIVLDISERKVREAELNRLASLDALTGVSSRRHGEEQMAEAMRGHIRDGLPMTLLILDIDHLKATNDTLGHQAGDELLADVAALLTIEVGTNGMVTRWGGDEFVILLRDCQLETALGVAEKIRLSMDTERFTAARRVSVSVGAAELGADDDVRSWVARADRALYEAKGSGRNTSRGSGEA